ncbi:MAG: hypothetical protein J0M20_11385 [Burkholderiales bacterium]|nr:hypothetical protein [Burkholderiales bacterium]
MNLLMPRLTVAALALGALAVLAARSLAPQRHWTTVLGPSLLAVVVLVAVVAALAWVLGHLGQALLRRGARDPAWGWFPDDPPGLPPRRRD